MSSGILKGNSLTSWHSPCITWREESEVTFMTFHSLYLHVHSFFSVPVFPIPHLGFFMRTFFFLLRLPEMCLFPTTLTLRAMCPSAFFNSFALFPSSLCSVLPVNLFYSRQTSSPFQLYLLILLHFRASFSLLPSLERREYFSICQYPTWMIEWYIYIIYTHRYALSPWCGVVASSVFWLLLINWWTRLSTPPLYCSFQKKICVF